MNETGAVENTEERGAPLSALVIDDAAAIRVWVSDLLAEAGMKIVGQATNGREGAMLTQQLAPDLVVLDIRMPGGSGIEALQRIKNRNVGPIVVILTNHGYSAYRSRCAELGADYFVDKSKEPERLREIVAELMAGRCAAGGRTLSAHDH